jgi:hypothetical protein
LWISFGYYPSIICGNSYTNSLPSHLCCCVCQLCALNDLASLFMYEVNVWHFFFLLCVTSIIYDTIDAPRNFLPLWIGHLSIPDIFVLLRSHLGMIIDITCLCIDR